MTECFFLYRPDRFDVVGGETLKLINKYYLTDFGFKFYILHNLEIELQQTLENVIYFELRRRRYEVSTGKVAEKEVDFVVRGNEGTVKYVQVAVSVEDKAKLEQELAPFFAIPDNYPKCILVLDDVLIPDRRGVKVINAIDFLLGRVELP